MPETVPIFDKVAKHYDSLNTFFSLGMDTLWRNRLAEELRGSGSVLDIATGTGEVAIQIVKRLGKVNVTALDPSPQMLELAREKTSRPELNGKITLTQGSAESLPFRDSSFDAVSIAFGIRNTKDPLASLREMKRVLRPGGRAGIMEFAIPENRLFKPLYLFYFKNILPLVASVFGTRSEYKYLSDSTSVFPQREGFKELMRESGMSVEKTIELMLGIVIIYVGVKKEQD